ncbi:universal stress protein [Bifidobacterium sp. DSM 109958]|uniref:Universal stress protein n=1 Tax=Bifidobacterium moraviense TaxID=2675323 RepID=A0A7Y0F0S9_9BIFI|nr:universal stress protein [Bifidobacterium sp. DSM 109958]NMM99925.1 universal stress protein [Bifidobacterium sp. DSM 109958]
MTQYEHTANRLADIVVGVDGSDESFAALRFALKEAGITGQKVNAVFGWTHSWDMGAEPDSDEAWNAMRRDIAAALRSWVERASEGIDFDPDNLELTSVKATGTSALLQIGSDAQQIVVGRRSLGRVARWFLGSLSASLAEASKSPVTVVRIVDDETLNVEDSIADALAPADEHPAEHHRQTVRPDRRPVVVGVDGSPTSRHALAFAAHEAHVHRRPLHVMFCWQLKDLGTVPGYENAIAPIDAGQRRAEEIVRRTVEQVPIPDDVAVETHAFHIPASKGLISASRYASWLVVGSRGLSGLDAHFLGSVSKQIVNFAECTVTVVH